MRIFVSRDLIKNSEIEPAYSRFLTLEPTLKRDRSTLESLREAHSKAKQKAEEVLQKINSVDFKEEITIPIHSNSERDEYADHRVEQRRQEIQKKEEAERARLQKEHGVIVGEIEQWERKNLPEIECLEKVVAEMDAEYEEINTTLDGYFILEGRTIQEIKREDSSGKVELKRRSALGD